MDILKYLLLPPRQTARQREVLRHLTGAERGALRALARENGRKNGLFLMGPFGCLAATIVVYAAFSPAVKVLAVLGLGIVVTYLSNKFFTRTYRRDVMLLLRNSAYAREQGIDLA